jgi:hypothetical protein
MTSGSLQDARMSNVIEAKIEMEDVERMVSPKIRLKGSITAQLNRQYDLFRLPKPKNHRFGLASGLQTSLESTIVERLHFSHTSQHS